MNGLIDPHAAQGPAILGRLSALSDPMRCRLLLLLDGQELTVSELCSVIQAPQSTVSRHLKLLADDGWIAVRPEGTSRFYSTAVEQRDTSTRRLWELVADEMVDSPAAENDRVRREAILARRPTRAREFFSSAAAEWSELRRELFGTSFDLGALPALLDDELVVGDLGCGTGAVTASLAPFVRKVIAIDASASMLEEARRRLTGRDNVDFRHGELEQLPIADGELDAATLMLVLHYSADPQIVLTETARALAPGGRLLLVDMLPHDRDEYRKQMGHVWLGFRAEQVAEMLVAAGFERPRLHPLPPDPEAKGPALFVASARKKPTPAQTRNR